MTVSGLLKLNHHMEHYDPLQSPDPTEWQVLGEDERLNLVIDYHRDADIEMPNEMLHATAHVIVENQLSLGEEQVLATLKRVIRQGLDRHEAIHAIGAVLMGHLHELLSAKASGSDNHRRYYKGLEKLTARRWLKGKC